MPALATKVIRRVFAAGEKVAPQIAGRAAFELFCRTPSPSSQTAGEAKAIHRAREFMAQARHHRLPLRSGCAMLHEFRPAAGRGQGAVLVIHGWRSRTEYMRAVIEGFLVAGYRVLSLDLPGHGWSSGRRLNMALAVAAVRAAAAMVGHSFGGAVAVNAAVGSVEGSAPVTTGKLVEIASPSSMPRLFDEFGRRLTLGPRSQSVVAAQVERVTGRPLSEFESVEQLRRFPIPTLVIHDENDVDVPPEEAILTSGAGAHVRLHMTRGLGHRRILSDPEVVRAAVDFVRTEQIPAGLH